MPYNPRASLKRELEAPHQARRWGSGWISGTAAWVLSLAVWRGAVHAPLGWVDGAAMQSRIVTSLA